MSEQSNNEKEIFEQALEQPSPEARAAFLAGACGQDHTKRERMEALLKAHFSAEGFLPTKQADPEGLTQGQISESPGTIVGRYKLLQRLGEGGFGVVYMSEQKEPVKRRVALKIIKLGMDTKQVVARFEAERQALALMDHPNIAKVLDAGSTETGRPYFVMELVRGIPITQYCDQEKLATHERLDLFIKVCHAIQHAHQKGLIHRDIKPSNILVTLHDGVPVPKVIDFGIAKATQQELTEKTIFTQFQQFIGTPAYMSPEQAEMSSLDIDTRCDIYSLGVLLYELLTGSTPFDTQELMESGLDAMRKIIREREPHRPSNRIGTLSDEDRATAAQHHSTNPPKLISVLRGDLDWIVMKCLEKDRTRRYETANGIAVDIKRHLNHDPVVARPPSTIYRFQKACRRNKILFTATAAVVVTSIIGITTSAWQMLLANQARQEAELAEAAKEQERQIALQERNNAMRAQAEADRNAAEAQRNLYASDTNLSQQAILQNNIGRARRLLDRHRPRRGQRDLRGWEWRYLWQQIQSGEIREIAKDLGIVWYVSRPSTNPSILATASNRLVQVIDMQSNETIELRHPRAVKGLAFSPDGTFLTSGCRDGRIRFWDYQTGVQLEGGLAHDHPVLGLSFDVTGHRLVVATQEQLVIWNLSANSPTIERQIEVQMLSYGGLPTRLAVSPDGRWIALGADASHILVYDLNQSNPIPFEFQLPDEGALCAAFSNDARLLAASDYGGHLSLFERVEDRWHYKKTQRNAHAAWISSVAFLPESNDLVSAGADQMIKFWDSDSLEWKGTLKGHHDEVWSLDAGTDGTLVTGSKDGRLKLWKASPVTDRYKKTVILADSKHLYCTSARPFIGLLDSDSKVTAYKTSTLDVVGVYQLPDQTQTVALGDEIGLVAAGGTDGVIRLYHYGEDSRGTTLLEGHTGAIHRIEFSHDGRWLVSSAEDKVVRLWNTQTGRTVKRIDNSHPYNLFDNESGMSPFAFSKDDTLFTVPNSSKWLIDIWATSTLQRIASLPYDGLILTGTAIVSGNSSLLSCETGGYLCLQDISDGQYLAREKGQLLGLHCLALSPDTERVAVGTSNEGVRLWSADVKSELLTLDEEGYISSLAFSPDSNSLVVLSTSTLNKQQHEKLVLYQTPTWEEIAAVEARRAIR